jgi:hypothetical protein
MRRTQAIERELFHGDWTFPDDRQTVAISKGGGDWGKAKQTFDVMS